FDAAGGTLANRRPLVEIPADLGVPDGLTVDADGFIWLAIWGGWCVRRYSPRGELEREIRLPVSQVSSCTFGGPDLRDLYATSATATVQSSPTMKSYQKRATPISTCTRASRGRPPRHRQRVPAAQEPDVAEGDQRQERQDAQDCRVGARPFHPRPLGRPEGAE